MPLMVGQTVSSYQILEKLGEGGMGVVYKALDVRLERFVALKFLKSEDITEDRKRRFVQEAKSVSALNHTGIIQVYDIGQYEGLDYLAMEFVEGQTLQAVTQRGPLPVDEALQYAIQIADAMSVAHAAGIVHRDLKPGNIIITSRKQVKVLDFGLAKLTGLGSEVDQKAPESSDTQVSPLRPVYTVAGMIVGSLSYMAPEQALGQSVDARSDIFAFGLLLYEMLAGRPAFAGTKFEVLSAIVHSEPTVLTDLAPGIPPQLAWIVARCLRKDPERRFQSMAEIRAALQDLRSESSSSNLSRSLLVSGVAPPATAPAKDPLRGWLLLGNVILFLLCVGAGLWILHRRNQPEPHMPQLTRLTTEGGVNIDPAISPDGKFIAFASDRSGEGNLDIWVRQIGASQAVRLTHDPAEDDEPTFSPDGTQIAFHSERGGSGLYLASMLGGSERRIADGGRDPQFSPDRTQIAYWKGPRNPYPIRSGSGDLFIVDLTNFTTRQIRPDFGASLYPVWSPDGKRILFVGLKAGDRDNTTYNWYTTPLDGGPAIPCGRMITDQSAPRPHSWRQHFVLFSEDLASPEYIGEIALDPHTYQPSGPMRPLTTATTIERSPSVTRDGRIVFSSLSQVTNLWRLPINPRTGKAKADPVPLTRDTGQDYPGSLSEDGHKLAFTADRSGNQEVWTRDMSTGAEHQLTFGGTRERVDPLISPDGRLVAWRENYLANPIIFITPFAGGTSRKASAECQRPDVWMPDSSVLLYRSSSLPKSSIGALIMPSWTHTTFMQDPILGLRADSLSTDGKWLVFTAFRTVNDYKIYVAPFSLSQPPARSSWIEVLRSQDSDPRPVWSKDGTMLFFSSSRDGYNCIWGLRLDKSTKQPVGQAFAVHHFHAPSAVLEAPNFYNPLVLGPDGMIVGLIERSGSIWMMN